MLRDGISEADARKRAAVQAEEDALSAAADHEIKNYPPYAIGPQLESLRLI
jgi:hypothetical protein